MRYAQYKGCSARAARNGANQSESDILEGSSSNADSQVQHQYFRTSAIPYTLVEKQLCMKQQDQGNTSTKHHTTARDRCSMPQVLGVREPLPTAFLSKSFGLQSISFPNKLNEPFHFPCMNRMFPFEFVLPVLFQNLQTFNFRFFFSTKYSIIASSTFQ